MCSHFSHIDFSDLSHNLVTVNSGSNMCSFILKERHFLGAKLPTSHDTTIAHTVSAGFSGSQDSSTKRTLLQRASGHQKSFLLHQLSDWLLSDDPAGEEAGCEGRRSVWLHVDSCRENDSETRRQETAYGGEMNIELGGHSCSQRAPSKHETSVVL